MLSSRKAPMNRWLAVGLLTLSILAIGACGTEAQDDPFRSGENINSGVSEDDIDWHNPIGGVEVGTLHQAQADLPFDIYEPKGLGAPTEILISPVDEITPESRVLALVYETKEYGLVVVEEHVPDVPVEQYQEGLQRLVEQSKLPNAQGSASLVKIRVGIEALMTVSEDESSAQIWWLQDGTFEMIIRGPNLDAPSCIAVANLI
ncbi:hypothetical protein BH20ACT24_BH20ACT24_08510 [soil metagenome]